jgi:serine/threonine-protein kinase
METAATQELRDGLRVKQRYELLSLIGKGGQGSVYRARDLRDGDEVAVKIMHRVTSDPTAMERMFREAHALVTLWGRGAVRPIDQGWTDDGRLAIVMELLVGGDLEAVCRHFERDGGFVPLPLALSIFSSIVDTVEQAHHHGIVHRDLKPGNVFVLSEALGGGVRVLDFGTAKFLRMAPLSSAALFAGSPSYVAPETWSGIEADSRVDVYSLGALMFRTVGGRRPFTGTMAELMRTVPSAPRPSLRALRPDLPAAIDGWVEHALAIERESRFQSVRALWNAFVSVLGPCSSSESHLRVAKQPGLPR